MESLMAQEDYVISPGAPETMESDLYYAAYYAFLHIVKAHSDSVMRNTLDEWFTQGIPWWMEVMRYNAKEIRDVRVWRVSIEHNP